ncbi:hypothetical protein HanXRQr2_Chr01g0040171 [Helianthus annuus]|uniref:Uncharacterized protein n=1 Tax=Helianthus annuus TaxID=4232 RepID=A0A9K3JYH8_HELAN|nr:hypothetical protein HanXRQr2_Chr01g0040171 [Helianthus annuus]
MVIVGRLSLQHGGIQHRNGETKFVKASLRLLHFVSDDSKGVALDFDNACS